MKPLRALFFALLLSSCEDPATPKDPVWGKQPCASCAMLVSDPRFAAQASLGSGQRVCGFANLESTE